MWVQKYQSREFLSFLAISTRFFQVLPNVRWLPMSSSVSNLATLITPAYAALLLRVGVVVAYPTEAVYGLGCDPFNKNAVYDLLALKQRDVSRGLILLSSSWENAAFLVDKKRIPNVRLQQVLTISPEVVTWVFPASVNVPNWIKGQHDSVALRITTHPIAKAICESFGCPIVSTSANLAHLPPARTKQELLQQFFSQNKEKQQIKGDVKEQNMQSRLNEKCGYTERQDKLAFVVAGHIGGLSKPTPIYDVLTGKIWRQ